MKLKKNIALVGKMHEGKSTVAGILAEDYGYGIWHFAMPVKELADAALNHIIDPRLREMTGKMLTPTKAMNRPFYQGVGARGRAYDPGIWIKQLGASFSRGGSPRGIVIDDMRYLNEAAWTKVREFAVIRIQRPEDERLASIKKSFNMDYGRDPYEWELLAMLNHESETEVDKIEWEILIKNDEDIPYLREQVRMMMEVI